MLYAAADNDGFKNEALTTILDAIEELTVSGRAGNLLNLHVAPSANIAVVGAPALILNKELDEILKASCDIPDTYEVANAFGAAVGRVTVSNEIVVSAPSRGKYLVHDATPKIFYDLEAAKSFAETQAVSTLRRDITQAGAVDFEISNEWDVQNVWLDGRPSWRPCFAVSLRGHPSNPSWAALTAATLPSSAHWGSKPRSLCISGASNRKLLAERNA